MKKSLIALAALGAFAGAASAQSSVTIYGIIDVGVSKLNNGTSNLTFFPNNLIGRPDVVTVRSATSSRLGFRGTEDLGGGLKANFNLEHRLSPDVGDSEFNNNGFWHGTSWVGLSGNFGEVRLGRQYVPAFYIGLSSDPWGYDYNVAGAAGFTRGGNGVTRANNAVSYRTPNLSGFSAEIQVAAGEGNATGAIAAGVPAGSGRNVGANLQYAGGPLWVGVGYNDLEQNVSTFDHRYFNVAAAYDFGFARPIVAYSSGKSGTSNNEIKNYLIGATVPLGGGRVKVVAARFDAAVGVNANAANTLLPGNATGNNTNKFGLGYEYFLSKRTSVHADVGTAKTSGNFTRSTGVEAGVKHVF